MLPLYSQNRDDPIIASLLARFAKHLEGKTQNLNLLVENKDWPGVSKLTHELQGATSQYGFPSLSAVLKTLHDKAANEKSLDKDLAQELEMINSLVKRIKLGVSG